DDGCSGGIDLPGDLRGRDIRDRIRRAGLLMNQPEPIISVRNVVNRFGAQTVHDGVSLDVRTGEVIGIVGGSGTGKSVLLRTMLGLHKPASGQVLVEGRNVCGASEE